MKKFLGLFRQSLREITGKEKITCIVTTGILLAASMIIETYTIEIPFAKINFAFIAIAAIGMLYGPTISFFAGGICDILGFIVHHCISAAVYSYRNVPGTDIRNSALSEMGKYF